MKYGLWIVVLVSLLLLPMSAAIAGKGGNGGGGGKPGGGGGSNLPAEELVFTARWDGTGGINFHSLYSGTANATELTRLNTDENHDGQILSVDPTGTVAGALHFNDGYVAANLGSGSETTLNSPTGWAWTHLRDGGGSLLSYDQQWLLSRHEERRGPDRPDQPGQPYIVRDAVLSAADGSGDFVPVTTLENEWNATTEIFTYREASTIGYVPQQTGGTAGEAWVIYSVRTLLADYSGSPGHTEFVVTSETTEVRVASLDVSDLTTGVLGVTDDVASSHPDSEGPWGADGHASVSPDGQWATVNRLGDAWLVPVAFSSGAPVVPEPTTSDLLAITPPSGWDADVQVRAVNHDGSLVALNLFRDEGKGKNKRRVRHLFVARSDGTDLTQIDVGTDGVEFEESFGDDSFISVAFVPPSGP